MAVFIYEDSVGLFSILPPWVANLAWLLVLAAIVLSVWQACSLFFDSDVTVCKGEISINDKMFSIIDEPGNTCIVSRNLSWTDGQRIMDSLKQKGVALGVNTNTSQPSNSQSESGTIVHRRWLDAQIGNFAVGATFPIQIQREKDQGTPIDEAISFGLAVSVEMPGETTIYEEVRSGINVQPVVRVQP